MTRPPVAVLVGPTAVGKTRVALALASRLGGEIINADSLQIYREMDIGSAKPTPAERALVPHHLLDLVYPDEPFDAARYCREGRSVLAELARRGVLPLVVGGTGFYIKALLHGLFDDGAPDPQIRGRLAGDLASLGLPVLYDRLAALDPATAQRLHPHDTYRILRALEVSLAAGRPISRLFSGHGFKDSPCRVLKIGLFLPREELYRRIEARVQAMLDEGWLDETRSLLERYGPEPKPLKALGYRQLIAYLEGRSTYEDAVERIKIDTRHYAKRQLTWFGRDEAIHWLHPEEIPRMAAMLEEFFSQKK